MVEAAGVAHSFYLTDLTVFKVMFSAIVTAMLGTFFLRPDRLPGPVAGLSDPNLSSPPGRRGAHFGAWVLLSEDTAPAHRV